MSEKRRKRPYRCTICGDRFAQAKDWGRDSHDTVYDPREWERDDD